MEKLGEDMAGSRTDTTRLVRSDIIRLIAEDTGMTEHEVATVYDRLIDLILTSVSEGKVVTLRNFGRFETRIHKGHSMHFTHSHEPVGDYTVLKFTPTTRVNRRLSGKL